MRKSRKQQKQRKIVIVSVIGLLCVMSVGYAAFQTNLNISAKGNVKEMVAAKYLKRLVVTSGDGLYKDVYEEDRYVYKGANPNNYIKFNNELWRIISIESDGIIKIVKNDSLPFMAFDSTKSNNWDKPSSLNIYLNSQYYNNLSNEEKQLIAVYDFYYGTIILENAYKENLEQVKAKKWNGKIGLLTISDFFKASNYDECNADISDAGLGTAPSTNFKCHNNNYLFKNKPYWLINASNQASYWVVIVAGNGAVGNGTASINDSLSVFPVTHLKSNIKLLGEGSETNPYIIKTISL